MVLFARLVYPTLPRCGQVLIVIVQVAYRCRPMCIEGFAVVVDKATHVKR